MQEDKNPLTVVGELIEKDVEVTDELLKQIGRAEALGAMGSLGKVGALRMLRAIKDRRAYEQLGMNWEEFCKTKVGYTARHVNRMLQDLPQAEAELAGSIRALPAAGGFVDAVQVEGDELVDGGKAIKLSEQNRERVMRAFKVQQNEIQRLRDQAAHAEAAQEKLAAERDGARADVQALDAKLREKERLERQIHDDLDEVEREFERAKRLMFAAIGAVRKARSHALYSEKHQDWLRSTALAWNEQMADALGETSWLVDEIGEKLRLGTLADEIPDFPVVKGGKPS